MRNIKSNAIQPLYYNRKQKATRGALRSDYQARLVEGKKIGAKIRTRAIETDRSAANSSKVNEALLFECF